MLTKLSFLITIQLIFNPIFNKDVKWFPINETLYKVDENLITVQTNSGKQLSGIVLNVEVKEKAFSCLKGKYKSNNSLKLTLEQFNTHGILVSDKKQELVKTTTWVPFNFKVENHKEALEADIIFSPSNNASTKFQISNFSYTDCN